MSHPNRPSLPTGLVLALLALGLCRLRHLQSLWPLSGPQPPPAPEAAPVPLLPPAFPPQDIVGRWGLAAYHKDEDRPRIEVAAARNASSPTSSRSAPPAG